jgi:hypothetical protein
MRGQYLDATISYQKGRIIVHFAREADSIELAIVSALECVKATGAMVERVEARQKTRCALRPRPGHRLRHCIHFLTKTRPVKKNHIGSGSLVHKPAFGHLCLLRLAQRRKAIDLNSPIADETKRFPSALELVPSELDSVRYEAVPHALTELVIETCRVICPLGSCPRSRPQPLLRGSGRA